MRCLELFSGCGGLAKGLELSGFNHSKFVEFNKDACNTLRINYCSNSVFEGDVKDFEFKGIKAVDIVAGGPPCQPFSLGGKHKANDDSRDMFPYAIKAINNLTPKAFLFENVKGLLRSGFSDYFRYILLRLTYPKENLKKSEDWKSHLVRLSKLEINSYKGTKYNVNFKLINAANYGVPQTRERVFIVGIRHDLERVWKFPDPTHNEDKLLWEKFVTHEYWKRHNINFRANSDELDIGSRLENKYGIFHPEGIPWVTLRDVIGNLIDPRIKSNHISDHVYKSGARIYYGHNGSDFDSPSKTLKAGGHGVPGGENMIRFRDGSVRYLTTYEAKLVQTFPADFKITGAWGESMRQIGNAVPVLLARSIGNQLYNLLI